MSSLATQLSQIATNSTNPLDLKAQKKAHSQSLIFDQNIASSQNFDTIYHLCYEGFQELCVLDLRFVTYSRNLFSEQSKTQDRTQMTAAHNEELNEVLDAFLGLVGARLLLKPAIKAVEWLVRRFRIHEYNTNTVLLTFLPYHDTSIFLNLLSILPSKLGSIFKFLHPYARSLTPVPRQLIVSNATNNARVFAALNNFLLKTCREQWHYNGLLSFWSDIVSEAVAGMLEQAQAGNRDLQRQKQEDVLLQVLPVLDEALQLPEPLELRLSCYIIMIILVNKGDFADKTIDGLMESVLNGCPSNIAGPTILCLSALSGQKQSPRFPRKAVTAMACYDSLAETVNDLQHRFNMTSFVFAFINSILHQVVRGRGINSIPLIEQFLFQEASLKQSDLTAVLYFILKAGSNLPCNQSEYYQLRNLYAGMVQRLADSRHGRLIQRIISENNIDLTNLEIQLTAIITESGDDGSDSEDIELSKAAGGSDAFVIALRRVPGQTAEEKSVLENPNSHVFRALEAVIVAARFPNHLRKIIELPILHQDDASGNILFWSTFVRVVSSPYPVHVRATMIRLAAIGVFRPLLQFTLPYLIVCLGDPSDDIRSGTSKLLITLVQHLKSQEDKAMTPQSMDIFYGMTSMEPVLLSTADLIRVIETMITPHLEEILLDSRRISLSVEQALRGSATAGYPTRKAHTIELKKSKRHDFFMYMKCHILNTPLYAAKAALLEILRSVGKVGSTHFGKELLPLLKSWISLSPEEVDNISFREGIGVDTLELQMSNIISANDRDTLSYWLSIMKEPTSSRSSLHRALFARIQAIWPGMKVDRQIAAADFLLEGALNNYSDGATSCREVLQNVPLHTDVLIHLFDRVLDGIAELPDGPSPSKRRRTSKGDTPKPRTKEDILTLRQLTFILELVDSSNVESRPSLLGKLFDALRSLQQLRSHVNSELAYVQNLALSGLLEIAKKARSNHAIKLDMSTRRVDLIVDCIQNTSSQQVQNTSLLLIANLANTYPDLVLHSVMPIFTFLGSSTLKNNDEYSTYVVDQTIVEAVPPLVQSLKDQKRDVVAGASDLLQSFIAAFEHIPSHRRLRLFKVLVTSLGPGDFLFAILAILAEKYQSNSQVKSFAANLASEFELKIQLKSLQQLLALVEDLLQNIPTQAHILLGAGDNRARQSSDIIIDILRMVDYLLLTKQLATKIHKELRDETFGTEWIRNTLSTIVDRTLHLTDALKAEPSPLRASHEVLSSLLGILSIPELIKSISNLLNQHDEDFHHRTLRLLETRIRASTSSSIAISTAALEFLPSLTDLAETTTSSSLQQAAIACVDQICGKYGKKGVSKAIEAAQAISGDSCLGGSDQRTQAVSVLCLASMIEVLGEAIVPVLPVAIPRSLDLLGKCVQSDDKNPKLHNAVYSMICALLSQLPWMVSGSYLDRLLILSFQSANADVGHKSNTHRKEALHLVARKIDFKQCVSAIGSTWSEAVSDGPEAVSEALSVLSTAIDRSPKSLVATNLERLRTIFFEAFDLRRIQLSRPTGDSYDEAEISHIEISLNKVAIKMIYKLNDSTFRPLFTEVVEWATMGVSKKDRTGQILRLTTFYTFLLHFFNTLKSIVTSYASHILDNAAFLLTSLDPRLSTSLSLWRSLVQALTASFTYDQDDFWLSPSHFSAISTPLISQISCAQLGASITTHLIPAIVALAAAADSPDHHKTLNSALVKYMRDEKSSVRLTAVKLEVELTRKLGEEWLTNLPEMLPFINEGLEDDDEGVEREVRIWVVCIEEVLGEGLEGILH